MTLIFQIKFIKLKGKVDTIALVDSYGSLLPDQIYNLLKIKKERCHTWLSFS